MPRKIHKGDVYDKERTKSQLISAVGTILIKEGFQNIRINRIEAISGLSKMLIYKYFSGLDGLIKAYLLQTDFWNKEKEQYESLFKDIAPLEKDTMTQLLKEGFEYLESNREMQKMVLWGISTQNKTIKNIADKREEFGKTVFECSDLIFKDTDIDFRAVIGLMVSAIYYIVLHGKMLNSPICGVDPSTKEGRERFMTMIKKIIELCYQHTENKKQV